VELLDMTAIYPVHGISQSDEVNIQKSVGRKTPDLQFQSFLEPTLPLCFLWSGY